MTRLELIAALDAELTDEALAESPLLVTVLVDHLRNWTSRHAFALRQLRRKQREPDPNGGPPEGGTPSASRGEAIAA